MERQAKETLAAVIDASPVAIVCSDRDRQSCSGAAPPSRFRLYPPRKWSAGAPGWCRRNGWPNRRTCSSARSPARRSADVEVKRQRKDGSMVDVRVGGQRRCTIPTARLSGVAWAYEDITDRKKAERQLNRLAHYDPADRAAQPGVPAERADEPAGRRQALDSVALFDLDGFKDVNDTLGHSTGDQLLVEVGQRLIEVAADGRGQVCRLGGDEFVVVMPDCGDPRLIAGVVESMLRRLAEPFEVNDHVLHLGGSAGIAIAPNDGASGRRADRQRRSRALPGQGRRRPHLSVLPAGAARAGAGPARLERRAAARLRGERVRAVFPAADPARGRGRGRRRGAAALAASRSAA